MYFFQYGVIFNIENATFLPIFACFGQFWIFCREIYAHLTYFLQAFILVWWCTKIDKYQVYLYCIPIQLYALAEYSSALVKIAELLQSTSTAVEQKSTSRAGGKAGSRRQCTSWGWPSLGQPCHGSLSSSPTNWKWLHTWINTSNRLKGNGPC